MMTGTIWIDVEDLIHYTHSHARPSGIQRVAFEISRVLHARCGASGTVRFVRYDSVRDTFRTIDWSEVETAFGALTREAGTPPRARSTNDAASNSRAKRIFRALVYRLPESLQEQAKSALFAQNKAFAAWKRLFGAVMRDLSRAPRNLIRTFARSRRAAMTLGHPDSHMPVLNFATAVAPGDTLLTLGAFWSQPNYAELIEKHRTRFGLRYALLLYDLIPLHRPEFCDRNFTEMFRAFFDRIVPLCDVIVTISGATAADAVTYTRKHGMALRGPVVPIPMGSGFGPERPLVLAPRTARLPPAGGYVLFVSTMEARKNHVLMFRVWRRLLEELPPDRVPPLVFAGRIGWLIDDLIRQIENTDYLDGKIIVLESPSDSELAALYQGCQFTVFPSLYEGWGLPVTESLSFGKPCLIADRTSLPEAGGDLVRRFDPDDLNAAFVAVRDIILDPTGLARWEERVRREFRPVAWTASAEALLKALEYPAIGGGAARDTHHGMVLTETVAAQ